MQRRTLLGALREVMQSLDRSGVAQALRPAARAAGADSSAALAAFRDYALAAESFTPAARTVARIFDIERLEDPAFWAQALAGHAHAARMQRHLSLLRSEVPRLLALLDPAEPTTDAAEGDAASDEHPTAHLGVHLLEEDGHCSTATRLIDALSACQEFYDALGLLHHRMRAPLAVAAIDAGPDKYFDLFGSAQLVKEVQELIGSIWGLVLLHGDSRSVPLLERIAAELPLLELVQQKERENRLTHEQALIIRTGILDGARKLVATGLRIDGLPGPGTHWPHRLATPEPKFTTALRPPTGATAPHAEPHAR